MRCCRCDLDACTGTSACVLRWVIFKCAASDARKCKLQPHASSAFVSQLAVPIRMVVRGKATPEARLWGGRGVRCGPDADAAQLPARGRLACRRRWAARRRGRHAGCAARSGRFQRAAFRNGGAFLLPSCCRLRRCGWICRCMDGGGQGGDGGASGRSAGDPQAARQRMTSRRLPTTCGAGVRVPKFRCAAAAPLKCRSRCERPWQRPHMRWGQRGPQALKSRGVEPPCFLSMLYDAVVKGNLPDCTQVAVMAPGTYELRDYAVTWTFPRVERSERYCARPCVLAHGRAFVMRMT